MNKNFIFIILILVFLIFIISLDPVNQDQDYYNFADQRSFLGIPYFLDVVTNIFFVIVGIMGLFFVIRNRQTHAPWSWIIFFSGTITVCFSSGYFHWDPNDATLIWDRLSLAVMFMSLTVAVISEHFDFRFDKYLLGPMVLIGIFSVVYWAIFNDLRFYIWIQLTPMILIPVLLIFYASKYSKTRYLWLTLIFYLLAKIVEIYDKEIFLFNSGNISGHSLKHIFAAMGLFIILEMLRKRQFVNEN